MSSHLLALHRKSIDDFIESPENETESGHENESGGHETQNYNGVPDQNGYIYYIPKPPGWVPKETYKADGIFSSTAAAAEAKIAATNLALKLERKKNNKMAKLLAKSQLNGNDSNSLVVSVQEMDVIEDASTVPSTMINGGNGVLIDSNGKIGIGTAEEGHMPLGGMGREIINNDVHNLKIDKRQFNKGQAKRRSYE